jgi:DNA-binding response OmpR family regulator
MSSPLVPATTADLRRILAVDDEPDLLETYERLLGRLGYQVTTAGTKHEALSIVEAVPLALVIADVRLPDGSGLHVVRTATAPPYRVPSIVVTGVPFERTRRVALEAGAAEVLRKPFQIATLLDAVSRLAGAPGK